MREIRGLENRVLDAVAAQERVDQVWTQLTPAEIIVASHLMQGDKPFEIAIDLGVKHQAVCQTINRIKRRLLVWGGDEL